MAADGNRNEKLDKKKNIYVFFFLLRDQTQRSSKGKLDSVRR
jgi:hypothetical protein